MVKTIHWSLIRAFIQMSCVCMYMNVYVLYFSRICQGPSLYTQLICVFALITLYLEEHTQKKRFISVS